MKNKIINSTLAALLLAATQMSHGQVSLSGGTFMDGLTSANGYWTYSSDDNPIQLAPDGTATFSSAGETLSTSFPNTGLYIQLVLPSADSALSQIAGDFTTTVGFSSIFNGTASNPFQLSFGVAGNSALGGGGAQIMYSYNGSGYTISTFTKYGVTESSSVGVAGGTSGSFGISRTGNDMTFSFDDTAIFTTAVTNIQTIIGAQLGFSGSSPSGTTYSGFTLSPEGAVPTPEPGTLALVALGGVGGLLAYRRRQ